MYSQPDRVIDEPEDRPETGSGLMGALLGIGGTVGLVVICALYGREFLGLFSGGIPLR